MAAYISFQPSDYFNTLLYDGNNSTQALTGVGFQPDATWIKSRNNTDNHALYDAVRGATETLYPNDNAIEATNANSLTSFDADGFTCGDANIVNGGTGRIYASWNWKAGTTSGLSGGTITPSSYSINTTSGFGIYTWAGTGVAGTIAHGLGVTPKMVILKSTTHDSYWFVYHNGIAADAETDYLNLNDTTAAGDSATIWNDTAPTSSVFSVGTNTDVNGSGRTYVAYVWADVKGYSKFGSYTGNGNADGAFVYTGFRPAYLFVKQVAEARSWNQFDFKRSPANVVNDQLVLNSTAINEEKTMCDFVSNGFKARATDDGINKSAQQYIYAAFAEFPIVSSNSKAGTAR